MLNANSTPYLDPKVQFVGVSKLRSLNATNLRALDKTLVIQDGETPLAVLMSYELFLKMQQQMQTLTQLSECNPFS